MTMPESESGGTAVSSDPRVTELVTKLEEQSKIWPAIVEHLGRLQMPPARAAGVEEGKSRGAGNAAGRGGAASGMPGTRLGVPTGGAGGVGPLGHPSAGPPLGSRAQGVWMQQMMDRCHRCCRQGQIAGAEGGSGGAERGAASGGGIVRISPPGSCLSELHAAVGVRTDDAAGGGRSSRSGTEGEPVRAFDVPASGGFGGFQNTDFLRAVGSSSRGAAGGGLTAPGTRDEVPLGGAWRIVLRGHAHERPVGTGPMARRQRGGGVSGGVAAGRTHEPVDRGKRTRSEKAGVLHSWRFWWTWHCR